MKVNREVIIESVNIIARRILSVSKETPIFVFMDRSPLLVASLQAIHRVGRTYIPLDPQHPVERITAILDQVPSGLILTESHLIDRLPTTREIIDVDELLSLSQALSPPLELVYVHPESPAYIIFTSGSTGNPKGVTVPRRALDNFLNSMEKEPGLTSEDRLLAVTTVAFDISILELFLPLKVGAELFLLDKDESRDPQAIISALEEYDITVMQATPATWKMMVETGWKGKKNLKILCGGETLSPELADDLLNRCDELWNMYGPTETTVWSTIDRVERGKPISIGKPIDNTDIYILNETLKPEPKGAVGDLYIGGVGLALGYYNRPDLTGKLFVSNPLKEGERLYKTGDLARYREDGSLECLGRSDFQVKIRGFRVELGEIESALLAWEGITNVVVHPQILRNNMKELVAYIVSKTAVESAELVTFLSRTLPDYMIPSHFISLDDFPLNPSGKIDRNKLPRPQMGDDILLEDDPSSLSAEEKILYVWRKVLQRQLIGGDNNFFEIGGNSILAVQALREINTLCGVTLSLSSFFKYPVAKILAEQIEVGLESKETVILLNEGGRGIPLFCLGGIDIYADLASRLSDRPVYGVFIPYEGQLIDRIQRGTLDEWQYMTIPGMAKDYLEEIRKYYPKGPCHFLGVSIAGIIAFEVSRMIVTQEGKRGDLFILDSLLPQGRHISPVGRMISLIKRIKKRSPQANRDGSVLDAEYVAAMRDCVNDKAIDRFDKEAQPLEGDVFLIKTIKNSYARGESYRRDLGWADLVKGKIGICELGDDHLGMLKDPHVNYLASFIEGKIERTTL
jgi:amino acid adenylation domain-containing protein